MVQSARAMWAMRLAGVMMMAGVCGCAQHAAQKPYECVRANTAIVIDGKIDDAEWSRANNLTFVVAGTDKPSTNRVGGRVMWDDTYLYVAFRAHDEDVWGICTDHDDATYMEDVLEVFVQPNLEEYTYYNFEVNPSGIVYDAMNIRRGAGGPYMYRWRVWNCEGLKVATSIDGTYNDPSDRDRSRTLEMAIPFVSLPTLKGKSPTVGDRWKFNLSGYDYSIYLTNDVERFTCSRLMADDFHRTVDFMTMIFVESPAK